MRALLRMYEFDVCVYGTAKTGPLCVVLLSLAMLVERTQHTIAMQWVCAGHYNLLAHFRLDGDRTENVWQIGVVRCEMCFLLFMCTHRHCATCIFIYTTIHCYLYKCTLRPTLPRGQHPDILYVCDVDCPIRLHRLLSVCVICRLSLQSSHFLHIYEHSHKHTRALTRRCLSIRHYVRVGRRYITDCTYWNYTHTQNTHLYRHITNTPYIKCTHTQTDTENSHVYSVVPKQSSIHL